MQATYGPNLHARRFKGMKISGPSDGYIPSSEQIWSEQHYREPNVDDFAVDFPDGYTENVDFQTPSQNQEILHYRQARGEEGGRGRFLNYDAPRGGIIPTSDLRHYDQARERGRLERYGYVHSGIHDRGRRGKTRPFKQGKTTLIEVRTNPKRKERHRQQQSSKSSWIARFLPKNKVLRSPNVNFGRLGNPILEEIVDRGGRPQNMKSAMQVYSFTPQSAYDLSRSRRRRHSEEFDHERGAPVDNIFVADEYECVPNFEDLTAPSPMTPTNHAFKQRFYDTPLMDRVRFKPELERHIKLSRHDTYTDPSRASKQHINLSRHDTYTDPSRALRQHINLSRHDTYTDPSRASKQDMSHKDVYIFLPKDASDNRQKHRGFLTNPLCIPEHCHTSRSDTTDFNGSEMTEVIELSEDFDSDSSSNHSDYVGEDRGQKMFISKRVKERIESRIGSKYQRPVTINYMSLSSVPSSNS